MLEGKKYAEYLNKTYLGKDLLDDKIFEDIIGGQKNEDQGVIQQDEKHS